MARLPNRGAKALWPLAAVLALLFAVVLADNRDRSGRAADQGAPDLAMQPVIAAARGPEVRFVLAEQDLFVTPTRETPSRTPNGTIAEWRLYLVRGDGDSELLLQTRRQITRLRWTPGTIWTTFSSPAIGYLPTDPLPGPATTGLMRFIITPAGVLRKDFVLEGWQILPRFSSAGSQIAFQFIRLSGTRSPVYVLDGDRALELDGLGPAVYPFSWTPDGSGLLVMEEADGRLQGPLHLVPRSGGSTTIVAPTGHRPADWSPNGAWLVHMADDSVFVFDRNAGASRLIASNVRGLWPAPRWSDDGRYLLLSGQIVSVDTWGVETLPIAAERILHSTLSPDGQYVLFNEDPILPPLGDPSCPRPAYLYNLRTKELRQLSDCAQSLTAFLKWLSSGRVLLVYPACWYCGPDAYRVKLLDVWSGELQLLTDGLEYEASAVISPDGARLLVTGNRLRLYSSEGSLLREMVPPEGVFVHRAAWSPDGGMFAYVTGPRWFLLPMPDLP